MRKHIENTKDLKAHSISNPLRPRLLTIKQAAAYLGRGTDSLRELVYSGVFPVIQEGERSKIWLDIEDLNSWILNKKRYMGLPANER